MLIRLLVIILLSVPNIAFAVCSGSSPTWYAANCSNTEISACITVAQSGDTIKVPAGSCTWTGKVTIPENKTIKLIAAGSSNTIISYNNPMILSLSANSRVSGFRFNLTGSGAPPMVEVRNTGWRVDNNYFDNQTGASKEGVIASGTNMTIQPEGVIDSNTFNECRVGSYGTGTLAKQNIVWAEENQFGTEHSVYVENNTIKRTSGNAIDANYAGKYVFRYNNVTGVSIMAHSLQAPSQRGTKSWEAYGNTFTFNSTGEGDFIGFMRGGTGVFYNNYVTGPSSYNYVISLDNVRSFQTGCCGTNPLYSGMCDGTSDWDGNTAGQGGWPCRDQIGRGRDAGIDSSVIGKATSSEPAYFWTNKRSTGANISPRIVNGCSNWIQANRDYYDYNASFNGSSGIGCGTLEARPATCTTGCAYWATNQSCLHLTGMVGANPSTPISGTLYKCTATNTWTAYYTPFTYPHPLRTSDPLILSTPSSPKNLNIQI